MPTSNFKYLRRKKPVWTIRGIIKKVEIKYQMKSTILVSFWRQNTFQQSGEKEEQE